MALYLRKANACFLHIPKTGGHWVEAALRRAEITAEPLDTVACVHNRHALRGHCVRRCRYYFCFVRHPADWYQSVWSHYQRPENRSFDLRTWNPLNPIYDLVGLRFPEFVHAVCDRFPDGFLSWLYEAYIGPNQSKVHYVGRTESLAIDLGRILRRIGYCVFDDDFNSTPPANVSPHRPTITPDLRRRILTAESQILRDYDYAAT